MIGQIRTLTSSPLPVGKGVSGVELDRISAWSKRTRMTDVQPPPLPLTAATPAEQTFPTLTAPQIERMASHGRMRKIQAGEVLFEAGAEVFSFFVVTEGQIEI